jgi:ACS family pantothenate transporter-like MFS transporter
MYFSPSPPSQHHQSLSQYTNSDTTSYVLVSFSIVCAMLEAFAFQGMFLLWLKYNKKRFSQSAITTYPLGIQAVAIVSQILAGTFIDATGHRLPMVIFAAAMQLITSILLLSPNMSDAGIFTAHYLSGTSFIVNPILYGWASTICAKQGDDAVRAVVLYAMAMGGLALYTWWGIVLYPATDAPHWRKGAITMVVVCFVFVASAFGVRWVSGDIHSVDCECGLICGQLDRHTTRKAAEREHESETEEESVAVGVACPTKEA